MATKGKPQVRNFEYLLIEAQNNAISTNYVKAKIDNIHNDDKCRLYGDRDETVILREYRKLTEKEYKTRHNWGRIWINKGL